MLILISLNLAEIVFVKFLHGQCTHFSHFHITLLGRTPVWVALTERGVMFCLLEDTRTIWNSSVWKPSLSSCIYIFIYSIICLYQYGFMAIYFTGWIILQYYFIIYSCPDYSSLWLLYLLTYPHYCVYVHGKVGEAWAVLFWVL